MKTITRLLTERTNRHAWLIPLALLLLGVSLVAAGLGIDCWWIPLAVLLAVRPAR